jgi:hypothetical protein
MLVGDQDDSGVAMAPAAVLRRGDEALDLLRCQVLTGPEGAYGRRRAMSGATVCFSVIGATKRRCVFGAMVNPPGQ